MGRKRTASYKRKRRGNNKARLQALIHKSRDPSRTIRRFTVVFFQRRNQVVLSFTGTGRFLDVDEFGRPMTIRHETTGEE